MKSKDIAGYFDAIVNEVKSRADMYHATLQEKERQQAVKKRNEPEHVANDAARGAIATVEEDDETEKDGNEGLPPTPSTDTTPVLAPEQPAATPDKSIPDETKDAMKTGDVTMRDIVNKLNAIRAGKSFKDESISAQMEKYVDGLDKAEKTALLAYLTGIQEIVSGVGDGEAAVEPSDTVPGVAMEKKNEKKVVHIKPNVIHRGGATSSTPKTPSSEDTTAPQTSTPIVPKKKQ